MPPPRPPPHNHNNHDHPPPPPKPDTRLVSFLLKAIIMSIITTFFFVLLGLASLLLLPLLFISLHRRIHNHNRQADLSNGFSPRNLNKLPQFRFSKRIEPQMDTEADCVVCLEGFKHGQWCRRLAVCGHVFHRKCVDTWLIKVASCPTCRTTVRLTLEDDRDLIWDYGRISGTRNDLRVC